MQTNCWISWLREQHYSTWESFILPYEGRGKIRSQQWLPPVERRMSVHDIHAKWMKDSLECKPAPYLEPLSETPRSGLLNDRLIENKVGSWRVSNKLDSIDFGNSLVYAAIGAYGVEEKPDLSRYLKVCGPQRRDIPLSPPHYDLPGGTLSRKIESTRLVLFGCSYAIGERRHAVLFRDFPRQRQARVRGTAVIVTTVENDDLRISMIDFAPMKPDLSLLSRVFVVENLSSAFIKEIAIHHLPVNSRGSWVLVRETGGVSLMDKEEGIGLRLYSTQFSEFSGTDLFGPEQAEENWQRFDLPLRITEIPVGGASSGWSVLVPRIAGGDPEEERAVEELLHFDPWSILNRTSSAWLSWSARVEVRSDCPVLDDLVDSLQCLLKTHEGNRGYHLGSTFQRHTHGWARDNYLMQRGLLAAGRIEEARHNLRGFMECVKQSGIACAYNIYSRVTWGPSTSGEICAYLLLMARDVALWGRETDDSPEMWEFIRRCADTAHINELGLVGFDGDEIWRWEMDQARFMDKDGTDLEATGQLSRFSVLDNCWLAHCALDYAERVASARGESVKAAEWKALRKGIASAVEERLWDAERSTYTAFLYPDGTSYDLPFTNGMCTPEFWGAPEKRPGSFKKMALRCGKELMTAEGIVKGNADTSIYSGLSPAFYLHALGSVGAYEEGDRYLNALIAATPSSGGAWEYTLVDLPYTVWDKRRGGDSGVLLAAIIEYIIGFRPTWSGFTAQPHLPKMCGSLNVKGLRFGSSRLDFELDQQATKISLDNQTLIIVPSGSAAIFTEACRTARIATFEEARAAKSDPPEE